MPEDFDPPMVTRTDDVTGNDIVTCSHQVEDGKVELGCVHTRLAKSRGEEPPVKALKFAVWQAAELHRLGQTERLGGAFIVH